MNEPILWTEKTKTQKVLTVIGWIIAVAIALGCGASTAAAFLGLNLVASAVTASIIAGMIFVAGTAMNAYIFKNTVPSVLIKFFGLGRWLEGVRIDSHGQELSTPKKVAMGIGFFFALACGITFGALAQVGTYVLPAAFPYLLGLGAWLTPIAATLGILTVVGMTALMFKSIYELIQKDDIVGDIKNFFKELVNIDTRLQQNQDDNGNPKPSWQIKLEHRVTAILTVAVLPLAAIGLFTTMKACTPGVTAILSNFIPRAAAVMGNIISLGFALVAQIPFVLSTAINAIHSLVSGDPRLRPRPGDAPATTMEKIVNTTAHVFCLINATGNTAIALRGAGAPGSASFVLGGIGGFINSGSAGESSIAEDQAKRLMAKRAAAARLPHSFLQAPVVVGGQQNNVGPLKKLIAAPAA